MDTTDKRTGAQKAQLAADTREQITQILQGHLMPLNAQVIHDLFDKIVAPLQQENDRLTKESSLRQSIIDGQRKTLSDLTEERNDLHSLVLNLTGESNEIGSIELSYIRLKAENDRLRLALSGKTGYDQVEVERERLRKEVENKRAKFEQARADNWPEPDTRLRLTALISLCDTFLSLLSSPVSGGTNDKEI